MKNNFIRIKFNDAGDESLSHTLKAYHLIDKLLEKTDHKYAYDIDVKDIKGNTVVDINIKGIKGLIKGYHLSTKNISKGVNNIVIINPNKLPKVLSCIASWPFPSNNNLWAGSIDKAVSGFGAPK